MMCRKNPKISVVLSFYNEHRNLPELLMRLRSVFSKLILNSEIKSYELIFVNDDSRDGSEEFLRSQMNFGDVILINMSRNFGVSECVLAGMEYANGDAIVYMDTDLQDPPEVIPELIARWKSDLEIEVVYTTRTRRKGEHWLKLLITKIGYRFINWISDIELQLDSGDFKLLSRRVVDELLKISEDKPYIRGLITWIGFKQSQIFYERQERFDGRENTKMPVLSKRVLYYWLDRALISFSDAPLKIMLFIGIGLSILSFIALFLVLLLKILGLAVPGWAAIMTSILFFSGVQIMMLGFIGLYVGAIFRNGKGRPKFIVKEVIK